MLASTLRRTERELARIAATATTTSKALLLSNAASSRESGYSTLCVFIISFLFCFIHSYCSVFPRKKGSPLPFSSLLSFFHIICMCVRAYTSIASLTCLVLWNQKQQNVYFRWFRVAVKLEER